MTTFSNGIYRRMESSLMMMWAWVLLGEDFYQRSEFEKLGRFRPPQNMPDIGCRNAYSLLRYIVANKDEVPPKIVTIAKHLLECMKFKNILPLTGFTDITSEGSIIRFSEYLESIGRSGNPREIANDVQSVKYVNIIHAAAILAERGEYGKAKFLLLSAGKSVATAMQQGKMSFDYIWIIAAIDFYDETAYFDSRNNHLDLVEYGREAVKMYETDTELMKKYGESGWRWLDFYRLLNQEEPGLLLIV